MSILNQDSFYSIRTSNAPPDSPGWWKPLVTLRDNDALLFRLRDYTDQDYWYLELFQGDTFEECPIETLIPDHIIKKIQNGEIKLMLVNAHEAYHTVVEGIYKSLVLTGKIPADQIIFLSESADILKEVKAVCSKYDASEIKVEWMREFENTMREQKNYLLSIRETPPLKTLEDKAYTKKFVSFNRMLQSRVHRPSLIALLRAMDVLDQGYVSAGQMNQAPCWKTLMREVYHLHRNDPESLTLLKANEDHIFNIGTKSLDEPDLVKFDQRDNAMLRDSTDYIYANSYFSVVTETFCLPDDPWPGLTGTGRILSEKTFKAIVQQHPFILVGGPGSLELLRSVGYKTFSPWINEQYDYEIDTARRLMMIAKEVRRLVQLTPTELTRFLNGVREICQYNYSVMMAKTHWIDKLN